MNQEKSCNIVVTKLEKKILMRKYLFIDQVSRFDKLYVNNTKFSKFYLNNDIFHIAKGAKAAKGVML